MNSKTLYLQNQAEYTQYLIDILAMTVNDKPGARVSLMVEARRAWRERDVWGDRLERSVSS